MIDFQSRIANIQSRSLSINKSLLQSVCTDDAYLGDGDKESIDEMINILSSSSNMPNQFSPTSENESYVVDEFLIMWESYLATSEEVAELLRSDFWSRKFSG